MKLKNAQEIPNQTTTDKLNLAVKRERKHFFEAH